MELSEVLVSLRRGWLTILLSIVIGILAATGVTMLIPPTYSSTASIMFVARGGSPPTGSAQPAATSRASSLPMPKSPPRPACWTGWPSGSRCR